jgi:hypothetical protein
MDASYHCIAAALVAETQHSLSKRGFAAMAVAAIKLFGFVMVAVTLVSIRRKD